ncbi:unnamed protein product [Angiostrongylus costaricensis]|uniref:CBS domain-containing protein n=1 Tax=Angiostrongylus costaricensis TaxID=334426 RepID=A0A0R3PXV6_ANGCS|nr:unnamed protein product [Angiostrongylus costaricensis]
MDSDMLVPYHEPDSYARLLQMNQCYEAMPTSSKVVIFDTELILWKAFNGLIYQNTRHVLLSNGEKGGLITGILSVTDFIRVILMLHRERKQSDIVDPKEDIGKLTIRKYRVEGIGMYYLLEAARLLVQHRVHRLPVFDPDTGSPLFILTHKRLLKFLWCFFFHPEFHVRTAKDLNVGSWVGIRVVFPDTLLTDCLDILLNKGVSGVPVVERDTFKVVDIYSRFDAVGIALEENACLGVTVEQAYIFNHFFFGDRVVSVKDTDTLWKAITVLVERNVHRLCAVNEKGAIEGIISLSDVINYMVVKPGTNLKPFRPTRRHYAYHTSESNDKVSSLSMHRASGRILPDKSGTSLPTQRDGKLGEPRAR